MRGDPDRAARWMRLDAPRPAEPRATAQQLLDAAWNGRLPVEPALLYRHAGQALEFFEGGPGDPQARLTAESGFVSRVSVDHGHGPERARFLAARLLWRALTRFPGVLVDETVEYRAPRVAGAEKADVFAARLLLPGSALARAFARGDTTERIAAAFGVPFAVAHLAVELHWREHGSLE